jgi:hypothetical protein
MGVPGVRVAGMRVAGVRVAGVRVSSMRVSIVHGFGMRGVHERDTDGAGALRVSGVQRLRLWCVKE